MLYFHGDIHGDPLYAFSYKNHPEMRRLGAQDMMIVLGDCGVPWNKETIKEDLYKLDWLNSRPYQVVLITGNHDNYDFIEAMPQIEFCGGIARKAIYKGKTFNNIVYIDKPTVMNLQGKICLIIPGANSHDINDGIIDGNNPDWRKLYRKAIFRGKQVRVSHISWWPQEKVQVDLVQKILDNSLEKVDLILSHEAPACQSRFYPTEEELYLDKISQQLEYTMWLHGHLHRWINNPPKSMLGLYNHILSYNDIINLYNKNQERMAEYAQ